MKHWIHRIMLPVALLVAAPSGAFARTAAGPVPASAQRHMTKEALLQLAKSLEDGGALEGAADIYQRLAKDHPADPDPLRRLGDIYARTGNADAAREALAQASRRAPEDAGVAVSLAKLMLMTGDAAGADSLLSGALAKQKTPPPAMLNAAGVAKDLLGDATAARRYYALGLDRSSEDPAIKNNLALSFAATGDYPTAVALLNEGLNVPGRAENARRNLAIVHALSGQMPEALKIAGTAGENETLAAEERHFLETLPKLTGTQRTAALFLRILPPEQAYRPERTLGRDNKEEAVQETAVTVEALPPRSSPRPSVAASPSRLGSAPATASAISKKTALSSASRKKPETSADHADVLVVHESSEAPMRETAASGPDMLGAAMDENTLIRQRGSARAPEAPSAPARPAAAAQKKIASAEAAEKERPYRLRLGIFQDPEKARLAWSSLLQKHESDLRGMTPVHAAVKSKDGKTASHLLAGAYPDFASATAACTVFSAKKIPCAPVRVPASATALDKTPAK